MIALYILGGLLLIIAVALLLPVGVDLKYDEDFSFKVRLAGITAYKPKQKEIKESKDKPQGTAKKDIQLKTSFQKLKGKYGFTGAVKEIFAFLHSCLKHLGGLLKTVKFRKVKLNLTVAASDAAKTAIQYGEVCSAVYPVLSYLDSIANIRYKEINVKSDFCSTKGSFNFSLNVRVQIIFLIITAYKIYKEYKNFSVRNGL